MKLQPSASVSKKYLNIDVSEIESLIRPFSFIKQEFEPLYVELNSKNGNLKKMLIRDLKLDECSKLLKLIRNRYLNANDFDEVKDFYDIVGARVYAELLSWYRKRVKDPYNFVGICNGDLIAYANGRLLNENINISLHTIAFEQGYRAGAVLYYVKCYYCFECLHQKEFWSTFESYYGWQNWGLRMALPSYPWPDYQHELGGSRIFCLTSEYWHQYVKSYLSEMYGITLIKKVPSEILEKNSSFNISII
ncbi:MAG: N-acetyltransferase [candidate division Zixibacteria bacterium]|nr:N-acetyltransferase [candidate division Zixibacteria bacterium]